MEVDRLEIKNTTQNNMFIDIDDVFERLDDTRINYASYRSNCLGLVPVASHTENELIYFDTRYEDLLSVDESFNFKCVIFDKNKPPNIMGIRPCKRGDFRGEINYLPPKTIYLTQSVFEDKKKLFSENLPICVSYNETGEYFWCPLINSKIKMGKNYGLIKDLLQQAYTNVHVMICEAWEDYFHWKIRVKLPEWEKSVEFWINPANIKSVFKLRDISDGEKRRKALKHIVSSHTRKLKSGEKIEIMRYLRGKEKFSENGYEFTIIPSKDDVKEHGKQL